MNAMHTVIVVIQVVTALAIIGLVLVQHGKGADMGAAFGSGASGSLFGATGSSNFLSKLTAVAATIFFVATLGLAFLGNRPAGTGGVMDQLPPASVPATSVPVPGAPNAPPAVAPVPGAPTSPASSAPATPAVPAPATPAPATPASGQSGQIPR